MNPSNLDGKKQPEVAITIAPTSDKKDGDKPSGSSSLLPAAKGAGPGPGLSNAKKPQPVSLASLTGASAAPLVRTTRWLPPGPVYQNQTATPSQGQSSNLRGRRSTPKTRS